MQHRAGVPTAGRSLLSDAPAMADWERSVRNAQEARPRWKPGVTPGYHVITFGFILGELVQRVAGISVPAFMERELLVPLGMRDTFLGLPDARWPHRVPVRADNPADLTNRLVARRDGARHQAEVSDAVPAACR